MSSAFIYYIDVLMETFMIYGLPDNIGGLFNDDVKNNVHNSSLMTIVWQNCVGALLLISGLSEVSPPSR